MSLGDSSAERRPTVLVVDDTKENLVVIGQLLQPDYHVRVANSGQRALKAVLTDPRPDLILLDVMMPEMDGYTVIAQLKADAATRDTPVIFVTAMDAAEDEAYGLSLGAVDYVTKPVKPAILLARVRAQLELKQARDWLADQNGYLEGEVHRRMAENELIKDVSLHALAMLAEKRDNETGNHLHRTQAYIELLMDRLRDHPRFAAELADPAQRRRIAKATPLHDIGKVGIPDAILLKPDKLTADEFTIMKTHARIGADALGEAIERVGGAARDSASNGESNRASNRASSVGGSPLAFLDVARQIAGGHHEKWDGSGYPEGLAGEAIPLPARLMALADVFDALVSRRHYKEAFPVPRAVEIIAAGRGRHFDPDIVDCFAGLIDEFVRVAERFADEVPEHDQTGRSGS